MPLMNLKKLKENIEDAQNIIIIAGAGVSTDSGLADSKSFNKIQRNNVFSLENFEKNPILFWKYYKEMFDSVLDNKVKANDNHYFIEDLINMKKDVIVITQNTDSLYTQVPNVVLGENYFELLGSLKKYYCPNCNARYDLSWIKEYHIPYCADDNCCAVLRPDIVLKGEQPKYLQEVIKHLRNADLVIVMGTSFDTYPMNQLLSYAGFAHKILINNEIIKNHMLFDYLCIGDIQNYLKHFKTKKREQREEEETSRNKPIVEESFYITDEILEGYLLENIKEDSLKKEKSL